MTDRRERGAALLVVVLMAAAATSMASAAIWRSTILARELRARHDVLCARFAALGGVALDAAVADTSAAAALVGPRVVRLDVRLVRRGPSWCVLRATAACGDAVRTIERTLEDPRRCPA